MQTARRLYLYLLSGISLAVLATGLAMLLTVLLEELGLGPSGSSLAGEDVVGEQLTLASALIAVSLPVWLIHWFLVERSTAPARPSGDAERTSTVRGLYFALALAGLLLAVTIGLSLVIEAIVVRIAEAPDFRSRSVGAGLATAVVAGAGWAYHFGLRSRDWSRGPIRGDSAWLPRAYLYGAALIGLLVLLAGVTQLLELAGRIALDEPPPFDTSATWWAVPLAEALSGLLLGGLVWVGHRAYAEVLVRDTGWRGTSERPARLRLAYFVAVLVAGATGTIFFLGDGVRSGLAIALDISEGETIPQQALLVLLPLMSAIPYAATWRVHARWVEGEAAASGDTHRAETAARLRIYPVVLVGLAFAGVAVARLLAVLIEVTSGGRPALSGGDVLAEEVARWAPLAVLGIGVWGWRWASAGTRSEHDPEGEAGSPTRRAALLLVLAASILSGIVAAGVIFYRLFGGLFGIPQAADPVVELSGPIGTLVVAAVIGLYHGTRLRRDQAIRDRVEVPAAPALPVQMIVRLRGHEGADLPALVAALRAQLPQGYAVETIEDADGRRLEDRSNAGREEPDHQDDADDDADKDATHAPS